MARASVGPSHEALLQVISAHGRHCAAALGCNLGHHPAPHPPRQSWESPSILPGPAGAASAQDQLQRGIHPSGVDQRLQLGTLASDRHHSCAHTQQGDGRTQLGGHTCGRTHSSEGGAAWTHPATQTRGEYVIYANFSSSILQYFSVKYLKVLKYSTLGGT